MVKGEKDLGVQQERIVVGGFSQGAALALLAGLTGGEKVAGVACLSGYLPLQWKVLQVTWAFGSLGALPECSTPPHVPQMKNQWANDVPIFVGHGTADPVIRCAPFLLPIPTHLGR